MKSNETTGNFSLPVIPLLHLNDTTHMTDRGMDKYLYEFQLQLNPQSLTPRIINQPILNVFKKKNLQNLPLSQLSQYEHPQHPQHQPHQQLQPEFEFNNPTKVRISCIRCRKFKKKCSREYPECSNCAYSDQLCKYIPRKSRSPHLQPIDSNTYTMKRGNLPSVTKDENTEWEVNNSLPIHTTNTQIDLTNLRISPPSTIMTTPTCDDKRIKPNDLNSILN